MSTFMLTLILNTVFITSAKNATTPLTPNSPTLRGGFNIDRKPQFVCEFQSSSEANVEYFICLNIDGRCFSGATVPGTSIDKAFTVESIDQPMFRKKVTCSIKAKWIGQAQTTPTSVSNFIFPDIELITSSPLAILEGQQESYIEVNITAPPQTFCCMSCQGNCTVTITTTARYELFYEDCSRTRSIAEVLVGWTGISQSENQETCGTQVPPTPQILSWQQTIRLPVKAYIDGRIDGDSRNTIDLQAKILNFPDAILNFQQTFSIGNIQVTARNGDLNRKQCKSLNDPHMTTFDGRRYENHNEGEFILYKHKILPYEVRAQYVKCYSRASPYCNCGAAIKSGDDVITFSSCENRGLKIELYKNNDLTPGTKVLVLGTRKYKVIMPTGTVVKIGYNGRRFINIFVVASAVDRGQTEGLCGSYDGNYLNDVFNPSTGSPDNNRYPNAFNIHWRRTQTIFNGVPATSFDHMNTFCSCITGRDVFCNRGHGIMSCSTSRFDKTDVLVKRAKQPGPTINFRTKSNQGNGLTEEENYESVITSFTYNEGYDYCLSIIENNDAVKSCWTVVNMTESEFNTTMENCAFDLQETGDTEWANGHITGIVEDCLNTLATQVRIENNTVLQMESNTTDVCLTLYQNCSQNGECVEGVCSCFSGFSGSLCNISASNTIPTVYNITSGSGSCGCDSRSTENCNVIVVNGLNFVDSSDLKCHYEYSQAPNFVMPSTLQRTLQAEYVSDFGVVCTLADPKDGVYVSVSNDGQAYSNDWYLHTVYDSVCFKCSLTGIASQPVLHEREDISCVINGVCRRNGETKPGDSCKNCDPSLSMSSWTQNTNATCSVSPMPSPVDEDRYKTTIDILAVFLFIFILSTIVLAMTLFAALNSKKKSYRLANTEESNIGLNSREQHSVTNTQETLETEIRHGSTKETKAVGGKGAPLTKPARTKQDLNVKKVEQEKDKDTIVVIETQVNRNRPNTEETPTPKNDRKSNVYTHEPKRKTSDEEESPKAVKSEDVPFKKSNIETSPQSKPEEKGGKNPNEISTVTNQKSNNIQARNINDQLLNELQAKQAQTGSANNATDEPKEEGTSKAQNEKTANQPVLIEPKSFDQLTEEWKSIVEDVLDKKLNEVKNITGQTSTEKQTDEKDNMEDNPRADEIHVEDKIEYFNTIIKDKDSKKHITIPKQKNIESHSEIAKNTHEIPVEKKNSEAQTEEDQSTSTDTKSIKEKNDEAQRKTRQMVEKLPTKQTTRESQTKAGERNNETPKEQSIKEAQTKAGERNNETPTEQTTKEAQTKAGERNKETPTEQTTKEAQIMIGVMTEDKLVEPLTEFNNSTPEISLEQTNTGAQSGNSKDAMATSKGQHNFDDKNDENTPTKDRKTDRKYDSQTYSLKGETTKEARTSM